MGNDEWFQCGGGPIVWDVLVDAFNRDNIVGISSVTRTRLTNETINLEGSWAKMNVPLAKAVFSEETVTSLIDYACQILHITVPEPTADQLMAKEYFLCSRTDNKLIYGKRFWQIQKLKECSLHWPIDSVNVLHTAEYLALFGDIFNNLFINKEERMDNSRYPHVRQFVIKRLSWLNNWKKFQNDVRLHQVGLTKKQKTWQKVSLATQTFYNLKISISGWFAFSHDVLKSLDHEYVSMLKSNQSFVELFFSKMRSTSDHLNSAAYTSSASTINLQTTSKVLSRNTSQDVTLIEEDVASNPTNLLITLNEINQIEKEYTKWISIPYVQPNDILIEVEVVNPLLLTDYFLQFKLQCVKNKTSIIDEFIKSKTFKSYSILAFQYKCCGVYDWVTDYILSRDPGSINLVTCSLWAIMKDVFECFHRSIKIGKNKLNSLDELLYEYSVSSQLRGHLFCFRCTKIVSYFVFKIVTSIFKTFMFNVYANTTHVSFNLRTSVSTADSFYEYIQFIGYAIVDLRKNVLRNKPTNTEIIQCLDSLVQPFSKLSDIEKGNV